VASAIVAKIRAHFPRFVLLVAWVLLVLWLALTPSPPRVSGVFGWDKLQHAAAFAVVTLLAGWSFAPLGTRPLPGWFRGWLFAVFWGALIEVLQGTLTRTRTADWRDFLADLLGAGAVYLAAVYWHRRQAGRRDFFTTTLRR